MCNPLSTNFTASKGFTGWKDHMVWKQMLLELKILQCRSSRHAGDVQLLFWLKQESIWFIYLHIFHPVLKFKLVLFASFSLWVAFRGNKLKEDEVWWYPGGDQRFGAFPNHSPGALLHSSHRPALSLSAEQLHRRAASSPLQLQLTVQRRPLQESDAGAEANRQHTSGGEWCSRSLQDVRRAPGSPPRQRLQQHRAAHGSMSDWMDLWQLLLHFFSGHGGTLL